MCVFDVHIFDTDRYSYYGRHRHKILSQHERRKNGKYLEACVEEKPQFMPLVFSVDGGMGEEKN